MYARNLLLTLFSVTAASCRVGPDYVPPETEVAGRFDGAPSNEAAPIVDAWWETFDDQALRACIEEAFEANLDARASLERIRVARALRQVESSRYWPEIGATAGYTWDRISENNPRFGPAVEQGVFPRDIEYWDVGFDVAWELDVFGGVGRSVEVATAELQEQELERGALMLTIAAEVARNYFELRGNQERLRMLEARVENERARSLILEQKRRSGILPANAALQSRSAERALRSVGPHLEAEIQAGEYRLAVLMGRRPELGVPELGVPGPGGADRLPATQGQVPTGLPSQLLRRRPDVLAAERRIAAASANIGVATAEFFPKFYLTGSPFLQANDFGELFSSSSSSWIFGPSVRWSLFSGGRNEARLEAAGADHQRLMIEYEATVNRVLEEVESSLSRYGKGVESLGLLTEAARLKERHTEIESLRYGNGIADRLDVLDSRALALEADMNRLDQQVNVLVQLVGLYKALGGGWAQAEAIARAAEDPGESAGAVSEEGGS